MSIKNKIQVIKYQYKKHENRKKNNIFHNEFYLITLIQSN